MAKEAKDSTEEVLQAQLQEDEKRLEADEKKIKRSFLVIMTLVAFVIVNLVIVYFLVLKPQQDTNQQVPQPSSTPTPSPTTAPKPQVTHSSSTSSKTAPTVKDNFISFGSGTSTALDWTDVGGLQANFDLGSYLNIKEVRFEASVTVPTANQMVWVRLFNKSDNHPVWNSEVSAKGESSYAFSDPVLYDKGEKTYQVQMKTQLGYPANLGQSRLHIILN